MRARGVATRALLQNAIGHSRPRDSFPVRSSPRDQPHIAPPPRPKSAQTRPLQHCSNYQRTVWRKMR